MNQCGSAWISVDLMRLRKRTPILCLESMIPWTQRDAEFFCTLDLASGVLAGPNR